MVMSKNITIPFKAAGLKSRWVPSPATAAEKPPWFQATASVSLGLLWIWGGPGAGPPHPPPHTAGARARSRSEGTRGCAHGCASERLAQAAAPLGSTRRVPSRAFPPARPQHRGCGEHRGTADGRDALTAARRGWPVHLGQITLILHQFLPPLPLQMHLQNVLPMSQRPGEASADQDQQPQLCSAGCSAEALQGQRRCSGIFLGGKTSPLPGGHCREGGAGLGTPLHCQGKEMSPALPCRARAGRAG